MIKINFHSKRRRVVTCIKGENNLNIWAREQGYIYMYLLNVPSFSSPYFNKTNVSFREIACLIARNPWKLIWNKLDSDNINYLWTVYIENICLKGKKLIVSIFGVYIHWTEVISSHHTIFAPVQKVKIDLTKFKIYKKVQGFVKTLQIMSFQNYW